MTSCTPVQIYRGFGEAFFFHIFGKRVEEKPLSPLCDEGSKFFSHISEILPNYTPHIPENVFFVVTSLRIPN